MTTLSPQPCWGSSTGSGYLSRSSGAALDLLHSRLWPKHLWKHTYRPMRIKKDSRRVRVSADVYIYLVWLSSTLRGEVAKRRSHIWMTGIRSSSDARTSWVATSGFQARPEQCIWTTTQTPSKSHASRTLTSDSNNNNILLQNTSIP